MSEIRQVGLLLENNPAVMEIRDAAIVQAVVAKNTGGNT
jgi:hypothetical protein